MPAANTELLTEAIARNAGLVLSLPSAGLLRHHKSRFLGEAPDGFWVESVPAERLLVNELIANAHGAGVSFKSGVTKVIFSTALLRHDPAFKVNASTAVDAVMLAFPTDIKAVQRRNNYRVAVPPDSGMSVTIWRIAERVYLRDKPSAAAIVNATLRDISLGGLGVTFHGVDGQPPKISQEDRLRVVLSTPETALLLEARMRKPTPLPGTAATKPTDLRTGITFKPLDHDLEGRQTLAALTRIVGALQRDEARRHRMGIGTPNPAA